MSETITASLTVSGGDTITAEINTLARGPAGPTGASGASTWDDITGTAASIPFAPGAAPAYAEGKVFYDSTDKSLSYYVDDSDVALNIGREMWVRVRNNSGSTIANGKVVYLSGATGQLPTIALARADSASTSRVIGVATHDIENNSNGYVTAMGEVKGIDTSAFADGDVLYLSAATAGALTTTAPTAPNRAIQVATVEHSHVSQGKLFVHPETDSVASTGIVDSTSTGRSLITAATQSDARTTGLGSGATGDALFTADTPAAARVVLEIDRTRITQALDLSNATTTFVDTDLVFTLQGGVDYLIRGQFDLVSTAAGTGFKLQLLTNQNVNALATTANCLGWGAIGGAVSIINSTTLTTADFLNFTGSSTRRAQMEIRINLVATGTARIRFAQNAGNTAPASVFKAGSFWTSERL